MCNSVCTHVILTDSTLWGWGDNTEGNVGNGVDDNFGYVSSPYDQWDWGPAELLQNKPVQIAPLVHNFTSMFAGTSACFLYVCGGRLRGSCIPGAGISRRCWPTRWMGATPDLECDLPRRLGSADDHGGQPVCDHRFEPISVDLSLLLAESDESPCNEYTIPADVRRYRCPGQIRR
jgi:hypothetical protein